MKPHLKLAFCDFWPKFNPSNNWFTRLLSQRYEVEVCERPEMVIYSCFGRQHRKFDCIRIFYTGENRRPDFRHCDFALSFDHLDDPRHFRLPLYAVYFDPAILIKPTHFDPSRLLAEKTRFCNFVYSNPYCATRNRFFRELSKYKPIDAGGKLFNNLGGPIADKLVLLRQSKFTIAFENESQSGYTTEKIADPMRAGSLPIYWGNPDVGLDFNPHSFINLHDWPNMQAAIDHIIEVDRNDEQYLHYLRQPWFHDNRINRFANSDRLFTWFETIRNSTDGAAARKKHWQQSLRFDQANDAWESVRRKLRRTARKLVYQWDRVAHRNP
ncbi:MAG: hypothetical protein IT427_13405 [Pirellulales bacterium]|nr:hypothetical protein [Pirellulales bacterium]